MPVDRGDGALGASGPVTCRGVRGATTVEADIEQAILAATRELLVALVEANAIRPDDVASILFTATPDLSAAFPARAARDLGWSHVPLIDAQEIAVPGGLPYCIRVLIHWNTHKDQSQIRHIYLRGAASLRSDLAKEGEGP